MNNKVSVIMPCYNDGEYIRQAVDSVYNQTYENLELIIIDDGSDKATKDVLHEIKAERDCILLETNHGGASAARNLGISKATGTYILPLDADDEIYPTYVEKAVQKMEQDENVGIVYCHGELFGELSGPWQLPDYSLEKMLVSNCIFVTALFRKEDWERIGGFNVEMRHGLEDYDFWLGILSLNRTVYQLPETLFRYRIKSNSRNKTFHTKLDWVKETYEMIYDNHADFFRKNCEVYAKALRNGYLDMWSCVESMRNSPDTVRELLDHPLLKNRFVRHIGKMLLRCIKK